MNKVPTPFDYVKEHVRVQIDTKHSRSTIASHSITQLEEIRRSAYWLMHYDPDVSRIHQHIKQECTSILQTLQKGTTYDQLQLHGQMQKLATVFDKHEHTLQVKVDEFNRSICSQEMREITAFQLQVTRYLKQELNIMIGSVQEQLSTSDGTFLGRMQNKFIHLVKTCLCFWTPEGIIRAYLKQYNTGMFTNLPKPHAAYLEQIANNTFNHAVQKLDVHLKHGDFKSANRIMGQFVSHKEQYQLMQQFQRSSPYTNQHGMPTCWQANPKWASYQKLLTAHKHDAKMVADIKNTLQQEHMQAQELCRQSGITEPTAQQLNQAHQLQKYHTDPNFLDIACKGLEQPATCKDTLHTLTQRSTLLHEMQTLLDDKTIMPSVTDAYYKLREQAFTNMAKGDLSTYQQEYGLSPGARQVLDQAGCDPEQFTSCKGNLVQQDTHAKLVDSLNKLTQKPVCTQAAQQLKDGVLDCAQAGNALNQAGNLKEAMLMSDICHVAVDHIWHFIDSGVSVGAGFSEGLMQGVATFYNTEMVTRPNTGESTISACNEPMDASDLRAIVRAETAETAHELLTLIRDIGEVGLEAGYGVKDSIESMQRLLPALVDITKGAGNCLATMGIDTLMLLDAAERSDVHDFAQHLDKMKSDCHQIKEGIDAFAKQLGAHINAHMPQDGQITKAHAKMAVRTGARMLTDGFVVNLGMKGVSTICKGVSNHLGQISKELSRIKEIKDISMAEVRKALLVAQLESSSVTAQVPTLNNGTVWEQLVKDQVTMLNSIVDAAPLLKTVEDVVRLSMVRSTETPSKFASILQRARHWLSMQPKPGYLLLPSLGSARELHSTTLLTVLQSATNLGEAKQVWLSIPTINDTVNRFKSLRNDVIGVSPGTHYTRDADALQLDLKADKVYDQLRATNDVSFVADKLGLHEEIVNQVKEHVFLKEHKLHDGFRRFDANFDISATWDRLASGEFYASDLDWFEHELAESFLMRDSTIDWRAAHDVVDNVFKWTL